MKQRYDNTIIVYTIKCRFLVRVVQIIENQLKILWNFPVQMLIIGLLLTKTGRADSFSQMKITDDSTRKAHIINLTHQINITPFLYQASNRFSFSGGGKSTEFSPNEAPSLGIRLQHKWLGLAFMYGPRDFQAEEKGKSRYINFFLNIYGRKAGFDVHIMESWGYFIRNKLARDDIRSTFNYPLRPDLSTVGVGLNGYYLFNHNRFSLRSSFAHNEIQKRSSGSPVVTISVSYYQIKADSVIVPSVYRTIIPKMAQIRTGGFYTVGIMPGYAGTLIVAKRIYLTGVLSFGLMGQRQDFESGDKGNSQTIQRSVLLSRGMARIGVGYNAPYFYAGIAVVGDNYTIPLAGGSSLKYTVGSAQIMVGTRIQFPKKFQSVSDWMDRVPLLSKTY